MEIVWTIKRGQKRYYSISISVIVAKQLMWMVRIRGWSDRSLDNIAHGVDHEDQKWENFMVFPMTEINRLLVEQSQCNRNGISVDFLNAFVLSLTSPNLPKSWCIYYWSSLILKAEFAGCGFLGFLGLTIACWSMKIMLITLPPHHYTHVK